jgi:hypothetical protein
VVYVPYQEATDLPPSLAYAPGGGTLLALYRWVPGFAPVTEAVYRWIARNRGVASRLDLWLWGADPAPPSYVFAREIFLRALAVVFAIAFTSFWVQAAGLVGPDGILPVDDYLEGIRRRSGASAYWQAPTLLWLRPDGLVLDLLCASGVLGSLLLLVGFAPRVVVAALWLLYLSLTWAGQEFLRYQWDILLLETALVAVLIAPGGIRPFEARSRPPPPGGIFLVHWLLFRLMFLSGAVKLLSGDVAWRGLYALELHYWTQPLPNGISAWAHALPPILHGATCLAMFGVELALPFLVFGPRRAKLLAATGFVGLQLMIGLTGNYGFFGILICTLCVLLVDDATWGRILPARLRRPSAGAVPFPTPGTARRFAFGAIVLAVVVVTSVEAVRRMGGSRAIPATVDALVRYTTPFRSLNSYGLFAVMTKDRPEIVLEGSPDGQTWIEYDFRYKPDRLDQRPPFVQPHMPRLDWQMWFAALNRSCRRDPWFLRFASRLLEGSKPVVDLLGENPFPDAPPRYLRSRLYRYRFAEERGAGRGRHWQRTEIGTYCPTVTLDRGRLRVIEP